MNRLETRAGPLVFPAWIPVTAPAEGRRLDAWVRPYLGRLAPAVMVAVSSAEQVGDVGVPLFVDSGGFAGLAGEIREAGGLGCIHGAEVLDPWNVLELQERWADVAFALDLPIPPKLSGPEARRRQRLTIANAHWALENRRRRDLPLYAVTQGWDAASHAACARELVGFDGIAIGGMVPRSRDPAAVLEITRAVRDVVDGPLHVFGIGAPDLVRALFAAGVQSVDSSSYAQLALHGRSWAGQEIADPSPAEQLELALTNLAEATGATMPLGLSAIRFRRRR